MYKSLIHKDIINITYINPQIWITLKNNNVITIENHSIIGGIGSAVSETLSEHYPTKVLRIGTNDEFGQSGEQRKLMDFYGLTGEKLAQKVIKFLGKN